MGLHCGFDIREYFEISVFEIATSRTELVYAKLTNYSF